MKIFKKTTTILTSIFSFFLLSTTALAADDDVSIVEEVGSGVVDFVTGIIGGTIGALLDLAQLFVDTITAIYDLFTSIKVFDIDWIAENFDAPVVDLIGSTTNYETSIAYSVYTMLIPIAATFLMIYFAMHITDLIMTDQLDTETFFKAFLYLIVSLLIMDNGYEFIIKCYEAICSPTTGLTADVKTSLAGYSGISLFDNVVETDIFPADFVADDFVDIIYKFFATLTNLFPTILMLIVMPILAIIVKMILDIARYLRAIKIAVVIAFAPIAFANIFGGSVLASKGFAYFKKILSLFLQGPIILISIAVACKCAGTIPYFSILIKTVLVGMIIHRVIKQSEEIADSLVGL